MVQPGRLQRDARPLRFVPVDRRVGVTRGQCVRLGSKGHLRTHEAAGQAAAGVLRDAHGSPFGDLREPAVASRRCRQRMRGGREDIVRRRSAHVGGAGLHQAAARRGQQATQGRAGEGRGPIRVLSVTFTTRTLSRNEAHMSPNQTDKDEAAQGKSAGFDVTAIPAAFPPTASTLLIDRYLTNRTAASARVFPFYKPTPPHYHATCDESLFVLSGRGT